METPMYSPLRLENNVKIEQLYTVYYFCFAAGHVFPGESHNFWEIVYVNSGALDVTAGQRHFIVGQGEVIVHYPNEFHSFVVTQENTSILVSGFECLDDVLLELCQGNMAVNMPEKRLLASLSQESEMCFGPTMDSANMARLKLRKDAPFGSQQLIRLYLEQLFLLLLRDNRADHMVSPRRQLLTDEQDQEELLDRITCFMQEHLDGSLDFETIRSEFSMSATSLKSFFASRTGMGVIQYYQRLRIDEARRLLRVGSMNITEISEHLGYSGIHIFSRQFKRLMHMSPTEYLKSIHYIPR